MAKEFRGLQMMFKDFRDFIQVETNWITPEQDVVVISVSDNVKIRDYYTSLMQKDYRMMVNWLETVSVHSGDDLRLVVRVMKTEKPGKMSLPNRLAIMKRFVEIVGTKRASSASTNKNQLALA